MLSSADAEDHEVTCLQPQMLAMICELTNSVFKVSRQARRHRSCFPTEPWSMPSSYQLGPQFLRSSINWACCSHCAFYFSSLLKHVEFWKVVIFRIPEIRCLLGTPLVVNVILQCYSILKHVDKTLCFPVVALLLRLQMSWVCSEHFLWS